MKNIVIYAILLLSKPVLANVDYVEAQLNIAKDAEGRFTREIMYSEANNSLYIRFELEWVNYDSEWHQTGFHLSRSYRGYVDEPYLYDCAVDDYGGILYDPEAGKKSYVYFHLRGEGCNASIPLFETTLPSFSFYGVPFLHPVGDSANSLKLTFFW